jgi:predicted nucleotide-binding protein
MRKTKKYPFVVFSAIAISAVHEELQEIVQNRDRTEYQSMMVRRGHESWHYDCIDEFLADLELGADSSYVGVRNPELSICVDIWNIPNNHNFLYSRVSIDSNDRSKIQRLSNLLDKFSKDCNVPEPVVDSTEPNIDSPSKPKIFIGHGLSPLWKELKDHLVDHHGYEVVSYESGARAGHTIRDIIEEFLAVSSFAILVMTGEDEQSDGSFRARQNVIHEIGLFQGRLGFTKAVVLKESDTEEFSNIHGIQQIRFSRGNIRESFGDVLATLHREFGETIR